MYPIPKFCPKLPIAGEKFKLQNNSLERKESIPINSSLKAQGLILLLESFLFEEQIPDERPIRWQRRPFL